MTTDSHLERLWRSVEKTESCWLWRGATLDGYGILSIDGVCRRVHRVTYESEVGEVPPGLVLDHLCRVRHCVNPSHLEPVTIKENVLRGYGVGATSARRTHCLHGHEYTAENTRVGTTPRGTTYRRCLACHRIRSRATKARARTKRSAKESNNA